MNKNDMRSVCFFLLLVMTLPVYAQKPTVTRAGLSDSLVWFNISTLNVNNYVRRPSLYPLELKYLDLIFDMFDSSKELSGSLQNIIPNSSVIMGVFLPGMHSQESKTGEIKSYSKTYHYYVVHDSIPATFLAMGIGYNNYRDFQYHVVLDDSVEIIPWSPVTKLQQQYGVRQAYANLGAFHYPGRQVLVEVVNKKNYHIRDGIIIDWRQQFEPVVTNVYLSKAKEHFSLWHPQKGAPYRSGFNTSNNLPHNLRIPVDSIQSITIYFQQHEAHPFFILLTKDTDQARNFVLEKAFTGTELVIRGYQFAQPGRYELKIAYRLNNDQKPLREYVLKFPFEVYEPGWLEKNVSFGKILPYLLGALLLIGLSFVLYYRYNRRKLKQAAFKQQLKQMQLQSLRAQLNPHFVFNALNSIKFLVHTNQVEPAGLYLNRFADLTRTILDTSEQELISLEDEIRFLHNYLQMEQLRYPFQYVINVDESINTLNTEIPHLLLQPIAENAVKHGVAGLQEKGMIEIMVKRQATSLELMVSDNGKGFENTGVENNPGKGLKLTRERIHLLNETYGGQVVSMNIFSSVKDAVIIITLKDWLS